jgi:hypothetical protein
MKQNIGSLKDKMNKIDKPLSKLTKRRKENTQINKVRDKKVISQQMIIKSRESLGNTQKTYILINWKI